MTFHLVVYFVGSWIRLIVKAASIRSFHLVFLVNVQVLALVDSYNIILVSNAFFPF